MSSTMKRLSLVSLGLILLGLISCSTNNSVATKLGAMPSPAKSEYLRTTGGGFVYTRGTNSTLQSCRYVVLLAPTKPLVKPLYLRTNFENPADPSQSVVVDSE